MSHADYHARQIRADMARGSRPHLCPGAGCAVCAHVADATVRQRLEPRYLPVDTGEPGRVMVVDRLKWSA